MARINLIFSCSAGLVLLVAAGAILTGCTCIPMDVNPTVDGRNWSKNGMVYLIADK